jgi:hypothetical protein
MKKIITVIALSTFSILATSCKKEIIQPSSPSTVGIDTLDTIIDTITDTIITPEPIDSIERILFTVSGPMILTQTYKTLWVNGSYRTSTKQNIIYTDVNKGDTVKFILTVNWPGGFDTGDNIKVTMKHTNNYNSFSFFSPYFVNYTVPNGSGTYTIQKEYIVN